MKTHYKIFCLMAVISMLILNACTKSMEGEVLDPSTNRAFTPRNFAVRVSQDTAQFYWNAGAQASGVKYGYTIEISTDSLFEKVDYTKVVDSLGAVVIDPEITVFKKYFARLRVNAKGESEPSRWVNLASSFRLIGQQYLRIVRNNDIKQTTVDLNWFVNANTADINKVLLTTDAGVVSTVDISPSEVAAGKKQLTGLTPNTLYTIQIMAGTKSKGLALVKTSSNLVFTKVLSPGDNLAAALTNAANGDLIGLNPGTYALTANVDIVNKFINLRSVSNNPSDTKIKVNSLTLRGDSSGIFLMGLDIDANYSGTNFGATLLHMKGPVGSDAIATVFKPIILENCIIHDFSTNLLRGNYGSAANVHKASTISMNNCIVYNINKTGSNNTYTFSFEKLEFKFFMVSRSTLYTFGAGLLNVSTKLIGTALPQVTFDYCTMNNFGSQGRYVFIDAGSDNNLLFDFRNSIVANTPLGVAGLAVSGTPHQIKGASAVSNFEYNNYFNMNTAKIEEGGFKLVFTGLNQYSNTEVDLGWTAATTNFSLSTLPADSPLLRGSSSRNTIGDPRWAY